MNKKDLVLTTINRIPTLTGTLLTEGTVRIEGTHFLGSVDYHYNSGKATLNITPDQDTSPRAASLKDRQVSLNTVLHCLSGDVHIGDEVTTVHSLVLHHIINNPDVEPF